MNNSEAKFILGAYRPSGRDAAAPAFAEALRQAEHDPELAGWFARSRAHDAAVSEKLDAIRPPAGLREAILAGERMSRRDRRPAWLSRPIWSSRPLLAAAAMLAIGLGLNFTLRHNAAAAADRQMAEFALNDMVHGHHGGAGEVTADLSRWLSTTSAPLSSALPVDFDSLRTTGCRTLHVAGHEVMEVCFGRNGAEYHLYVARLGDTEGRPHGAQFVSDTEGSAAVWADNRYAYTLVTAASMDNLKRLL